MTTPIVEHIAADIATAIGEITVAAGYNQTLTALRPTKMDFMQTPAADGVVLIKQDDPVRIDEEETPYTCIDWSQPFVLAAFVIDSDDAATPIDTRLNQVRSDIEHKLSVDKTRGGYALDTTISNPVPFAESPRVTGIAVVVEVEYRTAVNDPYASI